MKTAHLRTCACGCGAVLDTTRADGYTVYVDRVLRPGDPKAKTYYAVGHDPWSQAKRGRPW